MIEEGRWKMGDRVVECSLWAIGNDLKRAIDLLYGEPVPSLETSFLFFLVLSLFRARAGSFLFMKPLRLLSLWILPHGYAAACTVFNPIVAEHFYSARIARCALLVDQEQDLELLRNCDR